MPPAPTPDVHCLISRTCGYVLLPGQGVLRTMVRSTQGKGGDSVLQSTEQRQNTLFLSPANHSGLSGPYALQCFSLYLIN